MDEDNNHSDGIHLGSKIITPCLTATTITGNAPSSAPSEYYGMLAPPTTFPSIAPTNSAAPTLKPSLSANPTASQQPTINIENQNDLITCISVIDENDPFSQVPYDKLWETLRAAYPKRPFCLLQPNLSTLQPGDHFLYRPPAFATDNNTILEKVYRDEGNETFASNWYTLCNLDGAKSKGMTRVALFVDDSGSMTMDTVRASYNKLQADLVANGFQVVSGAQNKEEDYITPCITATVIACQIDKRECAKTGLTNRSTMILASRNALKIATV